MDAEERRLVDRCLAGDQDACAEFVRLYGRLVGTVIWRATGDARAVEDLAQETFVRAFRALSLFDGHSKVSTWLCTIAHRIAIDYGRKISRLSEASLPELDDARDALLERTVPGPLDPEQLALRGELEQLVRRLMLALPDKYRLPLAYAAIDELDYVTIGAMLNVPVGTVKTLVFRAKQLLRARVADAIAKREHV